MMENTTDERSRDKLFENISDNTQLETLKVLKKYNNTLLQKYNIQNGIPIVSSYFYKDYKAK